MENMERRMLLAGLGLVGAAAAASAASAGSLNPPPGPVAATGTPTDKIEPRVAVESLPGDQFNTYIISQPGSYYLTANLSGAPLENGISIQADGVTLDLNGFALIGDVQTAAAGINVPNPQKNLSIRNGTIRNWGEGVVALNASSSILERLRASDNYLGNGISVGNESAVRDCVMTGNGGAGLGAADRVLVSGCIADTNARNGMFLGKNVIVIDCLVCRGFGTNDEAIFVSDHSTISRCTVSFNAGDGIRTLDGCTVADCTVGFNGKSGILAGNGSTVRNCTVRANTRKGIDGLGAGQIVGNTCDSNGLPTSSYGINVTSSGNRVDSNTCTNNYGGFNIGPGNLIIRNCARGQGVRDFTYSPIGSSGVAAILNVVELGTTFDSTAPWANFIY